MSIEQVKANSTLYYRVLSKITGKDYYKTSTGVVIKTDKGKGTVSFNTSTQEITCDGLQNAIIEGTSKVDKINVQNSKNVKVSGGASDDEFTIKYSDTVKIDGGKGNNDKVTTYNSNLSSMKNAKYKERTIKSGNTTTVEEYDSDGYKIGSTKTTKSGNTTIVEEYDSNGVKISGIKTVVDDDKTVIEETDKDNKVTKETIEYKDGSKTVKTPNGDGTQHIKEYDKKGKIEKEYDAKYDLLKREIWRKESDGTIFETSYKADKRIVKKTTPDGKSITLTYDSSNNLIMEQSITDDGDELTVKYENDGSRIEERKRPDGSTLTENYDSEGNITSKIEVKSDKSSVKTINNSDGSVLVENYNAQGKLTSKTINNSDGSALTENYDSEGKLTFKIEMNADGSSVKTINNSDGSVLVENYNSEGKLTSKTINKPDGSTLTRNYDLNDNLILQLEVNSDGSSNKIEYNPDGSSLRENYDLNGNLISKTETNADSSAITHNYSSDGNLISKAINNADGSTFKEDYNLDGSIYKTEAKEFQGENTKVTETLYNNNIVAQVTQTLLAPNGNKISEEITRIDNETRAKTESKTTYDSTTGEVVGAWSCEYTWDYEKEKYNDEPINKSSYDIETHTISEQRCTCDAFGNILTLVIITYEYNGNGRDNPLGLNSDSAGVSNYQLREQLFQDGNCYSDMEYRYDQDGYFAECINYIAPKTPDVTERPVDDDDDRDRPNEPNTPSLPTYDPPIEVYDSLGRVTHSITRFYGGGAIAHETRTEYLGSSKLITSRITYDYEHGNTNSERNEYEGGNLTKSKKVQIVGQNSKKTETIEEYTKINGKDEVTHQLKTVYHYLGIKENPKIEYSIEEEYQYNKKCKYDDDGNVVNIKSTQSQVIRDSSGNILAEAETSYTIEDKPYDGTIISYGPLGEYGNQYELGYIEITKYNEYTKEVNSVRTYYGKYDYKSNREVSTIPTFSVERTGKKTVVTDLIDDKIIYSENDSNIEVSVNVDYTGDNRGYLSKVNYTNKNGNTTTTTERAYDAILTTENVKIGNTETITITGDDGVIHKKTITTKTDDYEKVEIFTYTTYKGINKLVPDDTTYKKADGSYESIIRYYYDYYPRFTNACKSEYYDNYSDKEKLKVYSWWHCDDNKVRGYSYTYKPKDIPVNSPGYYEKTMVYDGNMNMEWADYQFYTSATSRTIIRYDSNWHVTSITTDETGKQESSGQTSKTYTLDATIPEERYNIYSDKTNLPNHAYSIGRVYTDEGGKKVEILIHYDKDNRIIGTTELTDGISIDYLDKTFDQKCKDDPIYGTERRETLEILKELVDSLEEQINGQYDSEGPFKKGFNLAKELLNCGMTQSDLNNAIKQQKQMIKELEDIVNGNSDANFDEVYKKYTGKSYNQEAINKYVECKNNTVYAQYGRGLAASFREETQGASTMKELYEVYQKYYGDDALYMINKTLKNEKNKSLKSTIFKDGAVFLSKDKILTGDGLIINANDEQNMLFPIYNFENEYMDYYETKVKVDVSQIEKDYATAYNNAFGSTFGLQGMINKYCQEQNNFTEKLSTGLKLAGVACMVISGVGGVVVTAGTTAAKAIGVISKIGQALSLTGMFADNLLDVFDAIGSKNGLSKEQAKAILKETLYEVANLGVGASINYVSSYAFYSVLNATGKTGLAILAQAGADTTLSVLSSLIMSGDLSLSSEFLNTLLSVLSGINSSNLIQKSQFLDDFVSKNKNKKLTLDELEKSFSASGNGFKTGETRNVYIPEYIARVLGENGYDVKKYCGYDFTSREGKLVGADLMLLYRSYTEGIKINDLLVPKKSSASQVNIGDVYTTNGTDLYIKNAKGQAQKLNISKDTYCELFPVLKRYSSGQQDSGDCYTCSPLNLLMTEPEARSILLSCISEDSDGISFTLPADNNFTVYIKKGKGIESIGLDPKRYMTGSKGMQMLEYLYKVYDTSQKSQEITNLFAERTSCYNTLNSGLIVSFMRKMGIDIGKVDIDAYTILQPQMMSALSTQECFNEMYSVYKKYAGEIDQAGFYTYYKKLSQAVPANNSAVIDYYKYILGTQNETFAKELYNISVKHNLYEKTTAYDTIQNIVKINESINEKIEKAAGDGGFPYKVLQAFGYTNAVGIPTNGNEKIVKSILSQADKYIIIAGTYNDEALSQSVHLVKEHAYGVYVKYDSNGTMKVVVTNPWDLDAASSWKEMELSIDDFLKHFESFHYVKK